MRNSAVRVSEKSLKKVKQVYFHMLDVCCVQPTLMTLFSGRSHI